MGIAIQCYAQDNNGNIPYGPKAPPFVSPLDFYTSTGAPTSLISLGSGSPLGQPAGLGLLLQQYISSEPKVLFCPGSDQSINADAQLAKVGVGQAQCSYYYRHGGNTNLFDTYGAALLVPEHILLENLGNNRNGLPIRALAIDTQFLSPPAGAVYGIVPSTHHQQRFVDILFSKTATPRPSKTPTVGSPSTSAPTSTSSLRSVPSSICSNRRTPFSDNESHNYLP